ncbi:MAG TPA: hypothetical protein VE954_29745 [Oligoflexus sp.]|uniref:hypothetical protein n=1 Tax=Oligoflexus sp. TaxID=1971216 RepID=UPI002D229593|nr:hypothetical protein [Oligoflexus sp.]HYX37308.1 hypothetical protein [Oligoflexus sp.]
MQKNEKKPNVTVPASQLSQGKARLSQPPLPSHVSLLDSFLGGGLGWGDLSEWGLPWGTGLRDLILPFLVSAQQGEQPPAWVLWVYGQKDICVNPLAWHARGIRLEQLRFAFSTKPLIELKPLFLSGFFRVIVLDGVPRLTDEDYAFLARQARRLQQHILVLHPYTLTTAHGNVWARIRINCWRDFSHQHVGITLLKGHQQRQLLLPFHNFI